MRRVDCLLGYLLFMKSLLEYFFWFFVEGKVVVVLEVVILLRVGWEEFCYEVWGCVILVKEVGLRYVSEG